MPNLNDIKNLLQNNKITEFVKLNKLSSKDIIEFTNRYTNWAGKLFQHIDVKHAARVFKYLRKKKQEIIIKSLPDEKAAELLNALQPDDRTAFLGLLPGNAVKELLKILAPETRAETLKLLGYPEGSVGRLMTPDYCTIKATDTVQQVLDVVRQRGQAAETLNFLFVVDDNGVLIDDINIKEFLVVDPATPVEKLMDHQFIALSANDEQTETIAIFKNNSRFALPVINESGVLLGIVTSDDVLRLAEKENTREIQRIGGSEALEEPYTTISFGHLVKKRAGWLVILFLGEMLTATAMGFFEGEISKAVVLALFIPLIISSGGNSGSQASSIIIRAMALGEIKFRDWFYVMRKEIFSGLSTGFNSWGGRFLPDFFLAAFSSVQLWATLDAGGIYCRVFSAGGCFVGNDIRLHVADPAEKAGCRSRCILCSFCGDPGRCNRTDHLFFCCIPDFERNLALGLLP